MPENFENFKKVEIATGYDQTSIWDYKNVNFIKIREKLDFWLIFEVGNFCGFHPFEWVWRAQMWPWSQTTSGF